MENLKRSIEEKRKNMELILKEKMNNDDQFNSIKSKVESEFKNNNNMNPETQYALFEMMSHFTDMSFGEIPGIFTEKECEYIKETEGRTIFERMIGNSLKEDSKDFAHIDDIKMDDVCEFEIKGE